jgi:tRNA(Ile)-lysidine synthase
MLEQWDMKGITSPDHPWTAYLDADALAEPVQLRTRLPGDRFAPYGMEGHSVKVSELMINLKIPAAWRGNVPLVVAGGEVAWVCGRRIAEGVSVEAETRQVARFRFERTSC